MPPGHDHLRGSSRSRPPPRPALPGLHAAQDQRDRAEGARVLRPRPRPARGHRRVRLRPRPRRARCRCARSACSSASRSRIRRRSETASTRGCASPTARCRSLRSAVSAMDQGSAFEEYIDWRAEHPSDDLMTELLNAEYEDETGTRTRLTRAEVLSYVNLLAAAGNETTTRLIGWAGKVLAEHPDQRRELVERPRSRAERDRGAAALRVAFARSGAIRHQRRRAPRSGRSRGQRHAAA